MKKLVFGLLFSICLFTSTQAQVKIGENPQNLHFNSVLELESTSKALVVTRLSTLQMEAITPLNGAVIYNTDTSCLHYFNGTEWINLCEAENAADINLVDNGDDTYTFTNAAGDDITFETPAFTSNHTGSFGATFSSGIKITDDGNTVNIEVDQVHGNSILNKTIGRTKIADDAIGVDELGDTSVNTNNLIDESVTPVKIQPSTTPSQVLKTNATGTNVEWGTLDATNIAGQDLTADDASITVTGGIGTTLNATSIVVTDGGITNAKLDKTNIPLSGFGDATTDVSLGGFQINSLANPTLDDDAATKLYVDNEIAAAGVVANAALAAEVLRATTAENNIQSDVDTNEADADAAILAVQNDVDANETAANTAIALKEDTANKSTDVTLADATNTNFPTELAVKTYVDTQVAASDQVIVSTDAENDVTAGADGGAFYDDAALQTNIATNTSNITNNDTDISDLESDKEDTANKSTDVNLADATNTKFPTELAVKTYVDTQVAAGATALATKEDTANKSTDVTLADGTNTKFPTELAVKTYVDTQVAASDQVIVSTDADNDVTAGADGGAFYDDAALQTNIATNTTAITAETTRATNAENANTTNITSNDTDITALQNDKENLSNKSDATDLGAASPSTALYPTQNAVKTYVDAQVAALGNLSTTDLTQPTGEDRTYDLNGNDLFFSGPGSMVIGTNAPGTNKLRVDGVIRATGYQAPSNGSTTTPAYRFAEDLDTGISNPAADEIGFSVGSIEALNIDETSSNTTVTVREKLKLEGTIEDINNSVGTAGQVLTSTATGTEWKNPTTFVMGKANGANAIKVNGATISGSLGTSTVNFTNPMPDANYIINLTVVGDYSIYVTTQTVNGFTVQTKNNSSANVEVTEWFFTVSDF
ncbi:hypothetical protein AX016_1553 [Cellulophaga sp. RHA19]|uniref:beta strand repeat-containing protein n=1 Tax=Cellulophaga sp. RHA19 TaxID=1798237 RepID=UPI000C2BC72F|nr:hypothetical protein [Cellulophaga sp. RHA19]PKB43359.1 hypothetical protein AX016_1553 [Cellulophaga sp. RHA19]